MTEPTERGTEPFRWWVFDGWCEPCPAGSFALPAFHSPAWEAHYDNDAERGKHTSRRLEMFPECIRRVVGTMTAAVDEWSARLGYPVWNDPTMHGGGVHLMEPGAWLNTHLDYDRHPHLPNQRRALNLIAFLNPTWDEAWGGSLDLCDPSGKPVKRLFPTPGRLVAFECSDLSYHGVSPVSDRHADHCRLTAAVYYVSEAGPTNTRTRALFMPTR